MLLVNRYQSLATTAKSDDLDPEVAQFRAHYAQDFPLSDAEYVDSEITPELVLRGTRERFMPIVLTAVATALAFLPFVLFGRIPGLEIMQPMAIVVLGGLVTTTLVNLYLLPALYLWLKPQPQVDITTVETVVVEEPAGVPVGAT
jgi:hypothetical protein